MELGMSELVVIGIVALIVIGPKDLPEMFRQLGRLTAKMRSMAREFSRAMEQAANETGVKDVARDLRVVTNPKSMGLDAVKGAMDKFEKWDPIKNAAKPSDPAAVGAKPLVPPPMPPVAKPATEAAAPATEAATEAAAAAPASPPMGPATAALYEKQAARKAILKESAEKLRALEANPPSAAPAPAAAAAEPAPAPKARAPRKPKAAAPAAEVAPEATVKDKPARATRKKKATEE